LATEQRRTTFTRLRVCRSTFRPHLTFRADWARPAPSNDGAESNSERSKPWTYPLS
jgi:hypothetical protein